MADDEKPSGGPLSDLMLVVLGLVALIILWYANGGPQKADLRGIFLQPPAPLGTGEAYGPNFGSTTPAANDPAYPNYSTYSQ